MRYFQRIWFSPIDASFLAVFRIMFGSLMLFESVNYGVFLCLDCLFRSSDMLFKYQGFEWVTLLPGIGLELVFLVMGLSAIAVIFGAYYRLSMLVCTLCLAYLFLLDQALYLNHYYLALIFCAIMIFMPANVLWSFDAKRAPAIASNTVPAWTRFWLVVQLEIVLIYAGLVKLNLDWLNLEPMRLWMNNRSQDAHPFFQMLTQDAGIAIASYSVILLHLVGAPLLLWRRTRLWVFFIYCFFHLTNATVFNIGIFPWMTIAATLVLFDPNWPRQLYAWWQVKRGSRLSDTAVQKKLDFGSEPATTMGWRLSSVVVIAFMCTWLLAQIVLPLRHFSIPGDVAWNEAGHQFSWRMKLRDKRGTASFYVVHNNQAPVVVKPREHLTANQVRKMVCKPDLIWQFAQFLEAQYRNGPADNVKVYVDVNCSLNTREPVPLINRLIDLAAIDRNEPVQNWVLPNNKTLPKKFLPI